MKQPIIALIDCNNFFVSCERLFRPELNDKPVVVLSSNDGCAVSRSNEAKALGIPMGAPAFKYQQVFKEGGVVVFSANFELYGDLSKRLVEILKRITPRIEVYSVDESFLDITNLKIDDHLAWAKAMHAEVLRDIGIPVSIGIGGSKTLAKIASDIAKQNPDSGGACDLYHKTPAERQVALSGVPVRGIWGIGRRLAPQMQAEGVMNAANLAGLRPARARQLMGVHGEQMVLELNGRCCIPLERQRKAQKMISRGRTFGEDTNQAHVVEAALASFATQTAYRLRESHMLTKSLTISLMTDRHKPGLRYWHRELKFRLPTADTGQLISAVIEEFGKIYDKSAAYHRASVTLHDFTPDDQLQTDLLGEFNPEEQSRKTSRTHAVDHLNKRFGKGSVHYAAEDLAQAWQPRRNLRSPRYTTDWNDLPVVKSYLST
ncbi:MAG: Y-family DNA polymerase [Candidatus Saccharimonadales bacterium]